MNKANLNLIRHRISFEEACEAFFDPNAIDDFDVEHSVSETRYNLIGLSSRRLLFVVHTEKKETEGEVIVRIISARKAEKKHRSLYEQQN